MAKFLSIFFLLAIPLKICAQTNLWNYSIESETTIAPAGKLPFWFRANKYGSIPLAGTSESIIGDINKKYDVSKTGNFDWSGGIEVRSNIGKQSYITLIEGYLTVRKGIFEIKGGRFKDLSGITDSSLSSGNFSISGNALGIPQVKVAIPQYYTLPFFNKLFALKGSFSYGWIGDVPVYNYMNPLIKNDTVRYLQNSLYIKIGRPDWRLNLIGGINHHVMFGNEKRTFNLGLSPFETFLYAAIGKTYGGLSKVGNHIGSVDVAAQYDFDYTRFLVYRQNFFDVGALGHLANIADGLNGISIINKAKPNNKFSWHKLLLEFMYTKNQAGAYGVKVKSGDEDYYNNFEYSNGWTYNALNLGNPLLTSRKYTRDDLVTDPGDFIIDNRILALHTGFEGIVNKTSLLVRLTYSKNYGTYGTNLPGHSTGGEYIAPKYGLFNEVDQFSGYLELNKNLQHSLNIGLALGADYGKLYYNSAGIIFKLKKTFN